MMDDAEEVPTFSDSGEDYDTHNDETFGDETEDFKWEDTQPAYEFFEDEATAIGHTKVADDKGLGDTMNTNLSYDGEYGNEDELEASISRLVMDEFEDSGDETHPVARRVENTPMNQPTRPYEDAASRYFASIRKKHESPGDSSLLVGSSVWSMHPTTEPTQAQKQTTQGTLNQTNSTAKPNSVFNSNQPAPTKPKKEFFSMDRVPKELQDLREPPDTSGKRQMIGYSSSFGILYADSPAVKVKTVCEIESELLGEAQPRKLPPEKTAFGHITDPLLFNEMSYLAYGLGIAPTKNNAGSFEAGVGQPGRPTGPNGRLSSMPLKPRNVEVQDNQPPHQPLNINQPLGHGQGMISAPPMQFPMMYNPCRSRGRAFRPPPVQQRLYVTPPRMPGLPPPHQQQQTLTGLAINPTAGPFRGPYLPNWRNTIYNTRGIFKQERPVRYWDNSNYNEYQDNGGWMRPSVDAFNGLMTEKDKQRLRNIQIIQLQNDHPYTQDYYFQIKRLRKNNIPVDDRRTYESVMKMYPSIGTEHARNNYQPTHFENSLGKLQAVSALAPKKAIDTGVVSVENRNSWRSPARSTLLLIERIYSKVLRVEELDFRATLRKTERNESFLLARQEDLDAALALLDFVGMETVAKYNKGKVLISRIIGLMPPETRPDLFQYVIMNLDSWFRLETAKHEASIVYQSIRNIILTSEISDLALLFNLLDTTEKVVQEILKSKIGCSVALCLLHKVETCFDSNGKFVWDGELFNKIPPPIQPSMSEYLHQAVLTSKQRSAFEVFPSIFSLVKRLRVHYGKPKVDGAIVAKNKMDYYVANGATIFRG